MGFDGIPDRTNDGTIDIEWFNDLRNAGLGLADAPITKDADYTLLTTDSRTILLDGNSGTVELTLFTAVGQSGTQIVVKAIDVTNAVTIDANASETIDGSAGFTFTIVNEWIKIVSDGTNWRIIG